MIRVKRGEKDRDVLFILSFDSDCKFLDSCDGLIEKNEGLAWREREKRGRKRSVVWKLTNLAAIL